MSLFIAVWLRGVCNWISFSKLTAKNKKYINIKSLCSVSLFCLGFSFIFTLGTSNAFASQSVEVSEAGEDSSVVFQALIRPQESLELIKKTMPSQVLKNAEDLSNIFLSMPEGLQKEVHVFFYRDSANAIQPAIIFENGSLPIEGWELKPLQTFKSLDALVAKESAQAVLATVKGQKIDEKILKELLIERNRPIDSTVPFQSVIYPQRLIQTLKNDPAFAKKIEHTSVGDTLRELQDLETIKLKIVPSVRNLRFIVVCKARANTSLANFFDQRLPSQLPLQHSRISTNAAGFYGYMLFNPSSVSAYLYHLSQVFGESHPTIAKKFESLGYLILPSAGYWGFSFGDGQTNADEFFSGHWSSVNAPLFVSDRFNRYEAGARQPEVKQAFLMGDQNVWKVSDNGSYSRPKENAKSFFFTLNDGNILITPTAERMTDFAGRLNTQSIQNTQSSDFSSISSMTLDRAFSHYPTVMFQAKVSQNFLMNALTGFSFGKSNNSEWVYVACSAGDRQAAFTVDVPINLLAVISTAASSFMQPKVLNEDQSALKKEVSKTSAESKLDEAQELERIIKNDESLKP